MPKKSKPSMLPAVLAMREHAGHGWGITAEFASGDEARRFKNQWHRVAPHLGHCPHRREFLRKLTLTIRDNYVTIGTRSPDGSPARTILRFEQIPAILYIY